ncbi:MAG TPA: acylphosphatase [Tepidisphaeraceae bacterium]|nr:acylphosphatase [Tepidisphaeraceae bacterium]
MNRKTCHFSGHVQGVGFRYTLKSLAARYAVAGYVKNLFDGRVEMVMEGPEDQMGRLLADISLQMAGHVDEVTIAVSPATGEFSGFSIRH